MTIGISASKIIKMRSTAETVQPGTARWRGEAASSGGTCCHGSFMIHQTGRLH